MLELPKMVDIDFWVISKMRINLHQRYSKGWRDKNRDKSYDDHATLTWSHSIASQIFQMPRNWLSSRRPRPFGFSARHWSLLFVAKVTQTVNTFRLFAVVWVGESRFETLAQIGNGHSERILSVHFHFRAKLSVSSKVGISLWLQMNFALGSTFGRFWSQTPLFYILTHADCILACLI